jgi:hypothetical protein
VHAGEHGEAPTNATEGANQPYWFKGKAFYRILDRRALRCAGPGWGEGCAGWAGWAGCAWLGRLGSWCPGAAAGEGGPAILAPAAALHAAGAGSDRALRSTACWRRFIDQTGAGTDSVFGGMFKDDPGGLKLKHDRKVGLGVGGLGAWGLPTPTPHPPASPPLPQQGPAELARRP